MTLRHLVLVLGDQLEAGSAAFDGFDPACDAILQMEVREEATYIRQQSEAQHRPLLVLGERQTGVRQQLVRSQIAWLARRRFKNQHGGRCPP